MNNINLPTGPHNGGNRAFPQIWKAVTIVVDKYIG
jgi:hypothetical protein